MKRLCEWDDGKKICGEDAEYRLAHIGDKGLEPDTYLCAIHLSDYGEGIRLSVEKIAR